MALEIRGVPSAVCNECQQRLARLRAEVLLPSLRYGVFTDIGHKSVEHGVFQGPSHGVF